MPPASFTVVVPVEDQPAMHAEMGPVTDTIRYRAAQWTRTHARRRWGEAVRVPTAGIEVRDLVIRAVREDEITTYLASYSLAIHVEDVPLSGSKPDERMRELEEAFGETACEMWSDHAKVPAAGVEISDLTIK